MPYLNAIFKAIVNEAAFTMEMLGAGVTQIRDADYASKGRYFQAFTGLSTGLERIGKLVLMLDHYIDHDGTFPASRDLKDRIGHDLLVLYRESQSVASKRAVAFHFCSDLSGKIHQAILEVLNDFAKGDRYANLNILVGKPSGRDPIRAWFLTVDKPLYQSMVSAKQKAMVVRNAALVNAQFGSHATILQIAETGEEITDLEDASARSGIQAAVGPYRQLRIANHPLLGRIAQCARRSSDGSWKIRDSPPSRDLHAILQRRWALQGTQEVGSMMEERYLATPPCGGLPGNDRAGRWRARALTPFR
jgi:hypothetical protein